MDLPITLWRGVLAVLVLGAAVSSAARAEVFKCASTSGTVAYSDQPCGAAARAEVLPISAAPTVVAAPPQLPHRRAVTRSPVTHRAVPQSPAVDPYACDEALRNYRSVAGSLRGRSELDAARYEAGLRCGKTPAAVGVRTDRRSARRSRGNRRVLRSTNRRPLSVLQR